MTIHHRIGSQSAFLIDRAPVPTAGDWIIWRSRIPPLGALLATVQIPNLKKIAQGITPFWTINNHGPTIFILLSRSGRNKIELDYDLCPTVSEIDAFFCSGQLRENFMGV